MSTKKKAAPKKKTVKKKPLDQSEMSESKGVQFRKGFELLMADTGISAVLVTRIENEDGSGFSLGVSTHYLERLEAIGLMDQAKFNLLKND